MNFKSITTMLVAVIVVVLIAAAAVVPIVQEAQKQQITEDQNAGYMLQFAESSNLNLEIANDSGTITVGDYVVSSPASPNNNNIIFTSDSLILMTQVNAIRLYDVLNDVYYTVVSSVVIENNEWTATLTNSTTITGSLDGACYYASNSGDFGKFVNNNEVKVNEDSLISITYARPINSKDCVIYATGTQKDGFTVHVAKYWDSEASEYVDLDSATVSLVFTDSGDGYYTTSANTLAVTATMGGIEYQPASTTNNGVIAPLKYTYISEDNSITIALLGVIPLLIFVVPIMLIVRSFYNGRD